MLKYTSRQYLNLMIRRSLQQIFDISKLYSFSKINYFLPKLVYSRFSIKKNYKKYKNNLPFTLWDYNIIQNLFTLFVFQNGQKNFFGANQWVTSIFAAFHFSYRNLTWEKWTKSSRWWLTNSKLLKWPIIFQKKTLK